MQKNFTQLIAHFLSAKRYSVPAGALFLVLAASFYVWAAVGVTVSGGASFPISADLAANSSSTTKGFTTLGNVVILEALDGDFSRGGNLVLTAPTGWIFKQSGVTAAVVNGNPNTGNSNTNVAVNNNSVSYTATTITIPFTVNGTNQLDRVTISGVEVQALNGGNIPGSGNITLGLSNNAAVAGLPATLPKALSQVAGVARKIAFGSQPTNTLTGDIINPSNAVTVLVQDQFGNTVTSGTGATAQVSLTIGNNPPGSNGVLSGAAPRNAVGGVATFSNLSIDAAGTGYTLSASTSLNNSTVSATSNAFNINSKVPTLNAPTACITEGAGNTQITLTGTNFEKNTVVRVNGSTDNVVPSSVSATQLVITLDKSYLTTAGDISIRALNPGPPADNFSNPQTLNIKPSFNNAIIAGESVVCAGKDVEYTAPAGYTEFDWSSTDNSVVLEPTNNPAIVRFSPTAPTSGIVTITVSATNVCGDRGTVSFNVDVLPTPQAIISYEGLPEICQNGSKVLSAPEAPADETYKYVWLNGTTVVGNASTLNVTEAGSYSVTITGKNNCPSTSDAVEITVNPLPTVSIDGINDDYCSSDPDISLVGKGSPEGGTFRIFENQTEVASGNTFSPRALGAGTYIIEYSYTDGNTCTNTATKSVTIKQQPTITVTDNLGICPGESATLTAAGADSYTWSPATGLSATTGSSVIANPTTTTTYTVIGYTNGCQSEEKTVTVTVNPLPSVSITPTGPTEFCLGSSVVLVTEATPTSDIFTYAWYKVGTSTSISAVKDYEATASGEYYVVVTNQNNCQKTSGTVKVVVGTPTEASVTITGATTFCEGGYVTLSANQAPSGQTYTYQWLKGGVKIEGAAANERVFEARESGNYQVVVSNGLCEKVSSAQQVTVHPLIAGNTISSAQSICSGGTIADLTGPVPTGGNGSYIYRWERSTTSATTGFETPSTGTVNSQNYERSTGLTQTTWYRRRVISGQCESLSNVVEITVTPAITSNTISGVQNYCQGATASALGGEVVGGNTNDRRYQWQQSTTNTSTSVWENATGTNTQGVSYTPSTATAGTMYYRRVVNSGECTSFSNVVGVTVTPSITGNTIAGTQTVCSGGTIAPLTQASGTTLAGGATPYSYQWQQSANNSTWNDITTGGNAASYTPASQTVTSSTTTYYRRIVRGGTCSSESASVAVTVTPLPTLSFTGTIASTNTFYTGQSAINLTASPAGGTFSGPGVTGSASAGFTFNPCTAKAGNHTITYNYTSPDGAKCSNSISKTVTVIQSTYRAVITANPHPFCRGGGGTTYTAAVYRDVQPGEIVYPYLVNADGVPVDASNNPIPKGGGSYPVPNPDYPYPANTPESIKALSYRFFQPIVSPALEARMIDQGLFNYQWGKNDEVNRKNDAYKTKDAGLSSQDYYEVDVTSNSLCAPVSIESNRMYSAVLENYKVTLAAEPNPICQGAAVTFTATLGAAFPWNVANLKLDFVLTRGNVVLNPTSFTYTGANTITFTTDAAAAGGFIDGDQITARFSTNIDSYLPSSNCIEGPASSQVTIRVNDIVALTPTDQSTTICLNGTATFTAPVTTTGPATVTYTWTVGSRTYTTNTATLNIPTEITGVAGSYPVSVVVSNACETTSNLALGTLTVRKALALFTVSGGGSYCAGSPVSYPITLSGSETGVNYSLFRSGSTTAVQTLAGTGSGLSFDATSTTGTYTVQAVYATTPACGPVTMSGSASIIANPLPTVTVTSPTVCQGETATVTATPAGGSGTYTTYTWTVPAGWTSPTGATNPGNVASFQTTIAGTYTVKVTDDKSCESSVAATSTVTVNSRPTVTVNSPTVCEGTTATVTAEPSGGSGIYTTYIWTVPDGVTNPGNVASFQTTVAGTYTVKVADDKSCESSVAATSTVTINQNITARADLFVSPDPVMIDEPATFTAKTEIGGGIRIVYQWYILNEATNNWELAATHSTHSPTDEFIIASVEPGKLKVRVEIQPESDGTNCYSDLTLETGDITPLPVEIIYLTAKKQGNNVLLEWATASETDNKGFEVQVSEDGLNYRLLDFVPSKNGNTNTKQVYAFIDKEKGKSDTRYYRLKQIDHAGTFEFFGPKMVTFGTVASKVIAFPNPFLDEITLDIASETDGEMLVVITDAVGKQLMERKVQVEKGFTTEKVKFGAGLPNGLYIIRTQIGGYTQFIKMIKE